MIPLSFAGQSFFAEPDGALFWPAQKAILVADLHLEKASWYASGGQLLPPYDSVATLSALAATVERTGATRLFCLGDSFHDPCGGDRLPDSARTLLRGMTDRLDWTWILGNHDHDITASCGGTLADELAIGGVILRHEAVPGEPRPEISGHFHPRLRLWVRGRHLSRRCFVASPSKLILPAFGTLTGGLDANHPEIVRRLGAPGSALVPLAGRMLRFRLAA